MNARLWKKIAAAVVLGMVGSTLVTPTAVAQPAASQTPAADAATEDIIVFRNGREIRGKIVTETPTNVRFKGKIAGIEAEVDYPMADILVVKRGVATKGAGGGADRPGANLPSRAAEPESVEGKTRIYWMELSGEFGQDISETPIRNAIRDAKKHRAEVIIVEFNPDWRQKDGVVNAEKANDEDQDFQGIFRAEKILPVFVNELPAEFDHNPPRVVVWVKQAMEGAAFVPLFCNTVYFSSNARMGGIGNLSQLYGSTGDDVVREKLRSAFLRHAEGWAIKGGYNPDIIRAMGRTEFVMSYRFVDGKVELFEGYPRNPGEVLLTDDGIDENLDSLADRVRGTGNDVLTITADVAKIIGLSKGTVDTPEELLAQLGLDRTGTIVPGRSKQIAKEWVEGVDKAKSRIITLFEEYNDIQVQGDYQERTRARGLQIRKLEEIKQLIERWGEGLEQWINENGIPPVSVIMTQQEQIRLRQLADRK